MKRSALPLVCGRSRSTSTCSRTSSTFCCTAARLAARARPGIGFTTDGWYGLFAPKGTPPAVVALLNQEVTRILASPELRDRLLQLNIADAPVKSPKEFSKTIEDDLAVWSQIARSSSIKLD